MSFQDALLAKAIEEWEWFGRDEGRDDNYVKGKKKETVEPYSSRVGDYWLSIPNADYNRLVKLFAKQKGKLDGTVQIAWSAAFISYCMQAAGAGTSFPYAAGHATWIVKAIGNKAAGKLKAPLVGYRLGEIPLRIGDLIARSRTAGVTYDNAVAKGWFESHSDIVVEIDTAAKKAYVIGGNVGQSVSKAEVRITADGKLNDPDGWMVHIRNNIPDPVEAAVAAANVPAATAKVG